MHELADIELLRRYAAEHSEEAFAALVNRHVNMVYSAALRKTGNAQAAEEITQAVFIILAKKAGNLSRKIVLTGWLYQTTRLTASNFLRGEIRRAHREQEAYMQSIANEPEPSLWPQIQPLLEDAMGKLGEKERDAVALRFFEGKSFSEIATTIGASENAAKKRVAHALEKLQKFFFKRGVKSTADGLSQTITNYSIQPAPALLAKTVTAVALAKGATASISTATLIKGALKIMAWTKAKTAIVAGAVVLLAAGTTTVAVKEIAAHRPQIWQKGFNLFVTDKVPPQATILPTLPSQTYHASGTHNGKMLGVGQGVSDIFMSAYWVHKAQLNFLSPVPEGSYDFISNVSSNQDIALQKELQNKFGLAGHRETIAVDHFVLRVKSRNAPGLKRATLPFSGSEKDDSYSGHNQSVWALIDYLAAHLNAIVIDKTGLSGNLDIDFTWDKTPEGLRQSLLEQTGLELVPTNGPVEFVMIEDVNHPVVGIGAALAMDEQTQQLKITRVNPDSPASKGGLAAGFVIQKIDGVATADKKLNDCVNLIRGKVGTKVQLEVISPDGKTSTIDLTREKIQL